MTDGGLSPEMRAALEEARAKAGLPPLGEGDQPRKRKTKANGATGEHHRHAADDDEARVVLPYVDMSSWDDAPPPPREWFVPDRFPHRHVTLLTGEGAVGKSLITLQLLVSTVLARGWLDTMPATGPVLYVSCEEEEAETQRRLAPILDQQRARYRDLIEGGFRLLCFAGEDAVLAAPDRKGLLVPTPIYERIREDALQLQPRAIILDTSADLFGGDEINRAQVRRFIGLLRHLGIKSNSAIVLIGHPSITGINTGTGLSGSTGWHNTVRARAYMKTVKTKDGAELDKDLREIEFLKNNYGPLASTIRVRWKNGLYVLETGASGLDKMAAEAADDDLFLALLKRFTSEGRTVSPNPSRSYAPTVFAAEADANGTSSKAFAAAMSRLLKADKIHIDTTGPASKQRAQLMPGSKP
jgi:RecA-family ATPase